MRNRQYERTVQVYNESTVRGTGGVVNKSKTTPIDLCVLWLPPKKKYRHTDRGTFTIENFIIQVSSEELNNKNFSMEIGNTHIIKDGYDYRVISIRDVSFMNRIQLIECDLLRKIPMRNLQ